MGRKNIYFGVKVIIVILVVFLFIWVIRIFSDRHLDDISPGIECDIELIEKSDILFVIPKYSNQSISDNMSWCENVLEFDKELAMHGVYHTYEEFLEGRSKEYLNEGINIFEECFGFEPESFKAPQMELSRENKKIIRERIKIVGKINQIFHKTYHCEDTGILSNRFIDIF
jgi:predicted deacetylase